MLLLSSFSSWKPQNPGQLPWKSLSSCHCLLLAVPNLCGQYLPEGELQLQLVLVAPWEGGGGGGVLYLACHCTAGIMPLPELSQTDRQTLALQVTEDLSGQQKCFSRPGSGSGSGTGTGSERLGMGREKKVVCLLKGSPSSLLQSSSLVDRASHL